MTAEMHRLPAPLTITLTFTTATTAEFGLAVGERVDVSAYRFPALDPLPDRNNFPQPKIWRATDT